MKRSDRDEFLLVSSNRSPKRINLTPQKLYFKQSPGKIYPKYVESIDFQSIDIKDCTWVNIHVNLLYEDLNEVSNILTGEVQRFNIYCNEKEVIQCILKCMRLIDDRKNWDSYESLYFIYSNNSKVCQIGYLGNNFIFDMFLLPDNFVKEYKTISKKVNNVIKGLNFTNLRLTGKLDIDVSDKIIKNFEFRDSKDIERIFKIISKYNTRIELTDVSDQCFNECENSFEYEVKLCSVSFDRIDSIVSKIKKNKNIISLNFYIRYEHINEILNKLPSCKKIYCLLSNEDVGQSFSISRNDFNKEQELVARTLERKYPKVEFIFLSNKIFDKNVPSNFSKFSYESDIQDKDLDDIDGLEYPNGDDE